MRDVVLLGFACQFELEAIMGAYIGLLWLGWIPSPMGKKGGHRASRLRRRPTWTDSEVCHALAVARLGLVDDVVHHKARGAGSYASLARLSRFSRAAASPGKVMTVVRSAAPTDDL
jgi:hypothetical protein